jgi:threonine dehydratase
MKIPDFAAVRETYDLIRARVVRTPLLRSAELDKITGCRVWLKAEPMQVSGSFKYRGALSRLMRLSPAEKGAGVVAWSSGNHAQGVAAAAGDVGTNATIVMPADAPAIKIENTRRLGAKVVFYDRKTESREEIGNRLSKETGAVLVPSYDDYYVIAGQGTLGVELHEQLQERGESLDDLLVCCGGGGLVGGTSLAMRALSSTTAVYSVEPRGFDDHARSLAAGARIENAKDAASICDALLAPTPGELTWQINQRNLAGGLVVDDQAVRDAMCFAWRELKLVVEPGGAVALAAIMSHHKQFAGRRVGVVLSGGNVDAALFAAVIGNGR